jgi:hypothetical protein
MQAMCRACIWSLIFPHEWSSPESRGLHGPGAARHVGLPSSYRGTSPLRYDDEGQAARAAAAG